jgi:hypothetical protein
MADGFRLGQWVGVRRRDADSLSVPRRQQLDELGFVWDPWAEGPKPRRHIGLLIGRGLIGHGKGASSRASYGGGWLALHFLVSADRLFGAFGCRVPQRRNAVLIAKNTIIGLARNKPVAHLSCPHCSAAARALGLLRAPGPLRLIASSSQSPLPVDLSCQARLSARFFS